MMQNNQARGGSWQRGGTKYVFAGTQVADEPVGTKICPRCGEVLFADMDVCYGCLYDFSKDVSNKGQQAEAAQRAQVTHDPLESIDIDEIDDETDEDVEEEEFAPRHRKKAPSADDTIVESFAQVEDEPAKAESMPEAGLYVLVQSPTMDVRLPLGAAGLSVGRGEQNDIVLHSRSVSRNHLSLVPLDNHVLARDCGATNPATVAGRPIEATERLDVGDVISVCGTRLVVEAASSG